MKTYEVIIQKGQPSCGGKAPTTSEIREIETDDVVAYVRSVEKDAEFTVEQKDARTTVVSYYTGDGFHTTWEVTEA